MTASSLKSATDEWENRAEQEQKIGQKRGSKKKKSQVKKSCQDDLTKTSCPFAVILEFESHNFILVKYRGKGHGLHCITMFLYLLYNNNGQCKILTCTEISYEVVTSTDQEEIIS